MVLCVLLLYSRPGRNSGTHSRRTCASPKLHLAEKLNKRLDILTVKSRLDRPTRASWKAMKTQADGILARHLGMFDPDADLPSPQHSLTYLGAYIIAGLRLARERQVNV
jgi:hypothetical protein